jgi:predicted nucleic acid-binding protein
VSTKRAGVDLEATLNGPELVRFAWLTLWAFLRLSTNTRLFERPLSVSEAETAAIAALAIEHGATLYSTDRDFARFSSLKWRNPLR